MTCVVLHHRLRLITGRCHRGNRDTTQWTEALHHEYITFVAGFAAYKLATNII